MWTSTNVRMARKSILVRSWKVVDLGLILSLIANKYKSTRIPARSWKVHCCISLRVQVPNNHIPTQNLYYRYYYPNPKYLIIGYMDPLGMDRLEYFFFQIQVDLGSLQEGS